MKSVLGLGKRIGFLLLVLSMVSGCMPSIGKYGSSSPKSSAKVLIPNTNVYVESYAEVANGQADSAKAAISRAKSSLEDAKSTGFEWTTTAGLIKEAEKAYGAGDYDEATRLANEADLQSQNAIKQAQAAAEEVEPAVAVVPETTSNNITSYFVYKGDSLWSISGLENVYDNPYQWPLIYKANASKINDPDMIFPGQVLDINQNLLSEDVEAAIDHARNRGAWTVGGKESADANYLAK